MASGPGGMFVHTVTQVRSYFNMIFRIDANKLNLETEEIYGKVIESKKNEDCCEMHIEFTTIKPQDKAAIKALIAKIHPCED